jgi:two-component system sensor histidine kinase UhpB
VPATRRGATALPRWAQALLRVPLFYKILIANASILIAAVVAGTALTASFVRAAPGSSTLELMGLIIAIGIVITVLVNAVILRVALSPLAHLGETATRVQSGELDARSPYSPVADRGLTQLTWTFNGMLDSLAMYRRRLRAIAARALNAEEAERKRIARELHDETAQTLAAILIQLRLARGAADTDARDAMLDGVKQELARALDGIRRFARGLRPPALDELGLVAAIDSHIRMLQDAVGLEITLDAEPIGGLLEPEAELALYRIVQEALSNAVRHARATHAVVTVRRHPGRIAATITDDGRGFSVEETMADTESGLGLFGMKERAGYIGGRLEIRSVPGHGTTVEIEIPYAEEPITSH